MYGKTFPTEDQRAIEFWCFANNPPLGLGRYQHLRNAIDLTWNAHIPGTFLWNDWTERMMQGFAEHAWVTVTGPAASWKTTSMALYALCAWYSDPANTVVICTSTTLDGLRRRIWKEISQFWRLRPLFGNIIQSRNCIQFRKGHDNAGIFGIATDKGEIEKALGKIIGFHAKKMIVCVDEMPYTPEAIVEACVNLETGAKIFEFKGVGNADDQLDPHGRMCEPKRGWDSISVDSEWWNTKRGICIHLDGLKSPLVLNPTLNAPGLLNQANIDTTIEVYGADSPQFWQMRRGFWAPEGITKTVLNMPMIIMSGAQNQCSFDQEAVDVASLDPAFDGGDRCVLRFGRCGKVDGKRTLLLGDYEYIRTTIRSDDPTHYQIVRQVKEHCIARNIEPYFFALDSTGEGGGLLSIFHREWSREILGIEFGGRVPKDPVSDTNPKPADQEYDRMVTFLWFFFRLLVLNGQIRGLDNDTAIEFCRRWWSMRGPMIALETKVKMKDRTRKSPDLADNAVVMSRLCNVRLGLSPKESGTYDPRSRMDSPWKRFLQKRQLTTAYGEARSY